MQAALIIQRRDAMKTTIAVDTTLFVLALAVIVKLVAVMARHNSLSLLTDLPAEFQYLAGILF
jgi:hypothetical protein